MRHPPAVDMHPPQFGATVELGEHLARIEERVGIEGAFDALLHAQVHLAEHHAHEIALFDAHTMFAGEHAAPFGGSDASPEGWKEFESDWGEPILRQSLAQQVWAALRPEERTLARQAARGYMLHRKAQKKPPNVLSAHLFLKERAAWEGFAKYAPVTGPIIGTYERHSLEAKAIIALYAVARTEPRENRGRIVYRGEITPQLLRFADVLDNPRTEWIEESRQIASWSEFLAKHVHSNRPVLTDTRTIDGEKRTGIYAPWPWPPSTEGKIYTTGPPETLMSEKDYADFK